MMNLFIKIERISHKVGEDDYNTNQQIIGSTQNK